MKACVVCGRLSVGPRCPQHRRRRTYSEPEYRVNRAVLLANAVVCAICGDPPTPGNPLTADHVVPLEHGGGHGTLRAACRRCNSRLGQAQQQGRAR